ncbi:ATP-binding protein [Kibdelosporangium lantanae]
MSRWSARGRLTAMYGGMFAAIGLVLVVINYVLIRGTLPVATERLTQGVTVNAAPAMPTATYGGGPTYGVAIQAYQMTTFDTVLWTSLAALVIAGAIATWAAWYMSGRVLRPVHAITATARRLGAENLDRRINIDGPDDELKELANTFDGMLDRLATAFDSQTRFVANASHELRTPLAVQRTLVEVAMADPNATPELRQLGQHLLVTNERSERMIEGLLLLARSDRGLPSRAPVELDKLVENVLVGCIGLADQHNVTIDKRIRPRTVLGDPVLLERLVTNLVHNAVRYNRPGGSVSVEVGGSPALRVVNTGPVIPHEAVAGLFEPFRRLERTSSSGGSGLGLSIVRSVVKAHDGSIAAGARRAGGMDIRVELPLAYTPMTSNNTIPATT